MLRASLSGISIQRIANSTSHISVESARYHSTLNWACASCVYFYFSGRLSSTSLLLKMYSTHYWRIRLPGSKYRLRSSPLKCWSNFSQKYLLPRIIISYFATQIRLVFCLSLEFLSEFIMFNFKCSILRPIALWIKYVSWVNSSRFPMDTTHQRLVRCT